MADKGFTVEDLLPLGVPLNIPPFLGSKGQTSPQEVVETQSIFYCRHYSILTLMKCCRVMQKKLTVLLCSRSLLLVAHK